VLVFGIDQLVEVALCPFGGLFLVDELKAILIELLEELVPGDLPQVCIVSVFGVREAESEDASLIPLVGAADLGRHCAARFRPLANCVVILGCLGKCHC
jgi:hypothetical protein